MKTKTLSVLAGVGAPLILTGFADAGFVGIKVTGKPNPFGILVCNVYAIFDRPGEDRMESISGSAANPVFIEVHNGTFYNTPNVGTDQAPTTFLIGLFPSLAFDTFVTIGVKSVGTNGQPKDNLNIPPSFPVGITGSTLSGPNPGDEFKPGWGVAPFEAQGDPFDPVNSFPGNGQILIGQFATSNGSAISGTFVIQYTSNGAQFQQSVGSFFHVPGPGALAALGAAGLMGTRRRRR